MVVLFIVISNQVLQCFGFRFCDYFSGVELVRMWELGLVEIMFEGFLGKTYLKIYRRIKDKASGLTNKDRLDKKV